MARARITHGPVLRLSVSVLAVALFASILGVAPAGATTASLSISDAHVIEPLIGARSERFRVTLSAASTSDVTVHYATQDGTATAPSDYVAAQGNLTFRPGQTTKHFGVRVKSDTLMEGSETLQVNLSDAVGASVADGTGTGNIRDPVQILRKFTGSPLSDVVVDPTSTWAYATNTNQNEVEVLNIRTSRPGTPIFVGSAPTGLDITPDGKTLYVACSGGSTVWVVDIATGGHHTVTIPSGFSNDRPFSIAIANNGKAFVATTFAGSGFGAYMYEIDLATEEVTLRTDFFVGGSTTEDTHLRASFDRSRIGIVAGDISSGPVFVYDADTDSFSSEKDLSSFIDYVTMDDDGSTILVDYGTYVLDDTPALQGTISGGGGGVGIQPNGTVGYRVNGASSIDVLDVTRFLSVRSLALKDSNEGRGELAVAPNGSIMVVLTAQGITTQTT